MPTLNLEEYQYADDGVLLNGSSNDLPFVDVESIEGLDTAPYRVQTHDREGIDGAYVDAEFETLRTITIEGIIYTVPTRTQQYLDELNANFEPTKLAKPFYFQTDSGLRVVWGKSLGINYRKDRMRRLGMHEFQIQILCSDPRFYDPVPITRSTALASVVTSGRTYPKSYPVIYGAAASNNALQITLGGNRRTPGKLHITGPVVNPSIVYDNTGTTFAFNTTIATGDYIEIDLANRSVLLNGDTPRRNVMTLIGTWYYLTPGENFFRFFGTQSPATPAATLEVSAYSAWR